MKPFSKITFGGLLVYFIAWLICAALWFVCRVTVGFILGSPDGDWHYAAKTCLFTSAMLALLVFALGQTYEARKYEQNKKDKESHF